MIYNYKQTTASHVPILIEFIKNFKPERIIEFGGGVFSTGIFKRYGIDIITIESNKEWVEKLRQKYNTNINIEKPENMKNYLQNHNTLIDMVFIDSISGIRKELINKSFGVAETIIAHDTQRKELLNINHNYYYKIIFKNPPCSYKNGKKPFTTLWTMQDNIKNHFWKIEPGIYKRHKFPYGVKK